jgi:hypothetical protein
VPLVVQQYVSRPEEIVDHFYQDFIANAEPMGIAYVGTYDEKLIPSYPAVVISAGPVEKELHGTSTYAIRLRTFFYVMHATLSLDHRIRNQEDLELATRVVDFIERDMTLGGKVVHGWVESEAPGVMSPRSEKGSAVVGTRLHYSALSERRFK